MEIEPAIDGPFDAWKKAAREALERGIAPEGMRWSERGASQSELALRSAVNESARRGVASRISVPRAFMELAREASCHRAEERWALLYRILWRLTHGEAHLLEIAVDADVSTLQAMAKAVRRDMHKMRAFVRFREVATAGGPRFVAWFEPQHRIVEENAPFFVERFPEMTWSILTPDRCAHWDRRELRFSPGVDRSAAPTNDDVEALWRGYYASIFNPARVKVGAMTAEMPRHYWKNLPEAEIIPSLLAEAPERVTSMMAASEKKRERPDDFHPAPVPRTDDLERLREAAALCRACPLWRNATCTVFGAGKPRARVVLVGEQPGDQEDRAGEPFVGPAGQLLNRALEAAGVDRRTLYLTNAVKHFKWEPRGKRRLHQKPNAREIAACRPWLEAEMRSIEPELIVCLGSTAARSVVGRPVRVLSERGQKRETEFGVPALITVHPSSLLRLPESVDAEAAFDEFVSDLRKIRTSIA